MEHDVKKQLFVCKDGECALRRSLGFGEVIRGLLEARRSDQPVEVYAHSCFGLCDDGPHVIVYPDRIWYVGVDEDDLPSIIDYVLGVGPSLRHLETADEEAIEFILKVLDSEGFDGEVEAPRAQAARPSVLREARAPGRAAIMVQDPPDPFSVWLAKRSEDPEALITALERSGLRGRGGAGFPVGRKLALTRGSPGSPRYVVVNGAEDEPGSAKDQLLLSAFPDLVVEGALLAAHAVGAAHIVFYLAEDCPESVEAINAALLRATEVGLQLVGPADQTADTPGLLTASTVLSPPTYVAGEDTAALELIEAREPLPRAKPPYPATGGLQGKPTLVSNVETLAALERIAWRGPDWYRSFGTAESAGTMLFTLGEEVVRPGVYELELGTPLRDLVERYGGGLRSGEDVRFVLPGGPSSGFLGADQLDVPLSYEGLRDVGSALGCGVVSVYGAGRCAVEALEELLEFFAGECCGQCPPCRMETGLLVRLARQIKGGTGSEDLLAKMVETVEFGAAKGGLCSFITMPGLPVRSALSLFPGDFHEHLHSGGCGPGLA